MRPGEASSLIRLLGGAGAHGATLDLCRGYCCDLLAAAVKEEEGSGGSKWDDTIVRLYVAAISSVAARRQARDGRAPRRRTAPMPCS